MNARAPVPAPAGSVHRVLVILPSWVGDVCMATPALAHVAQCHPAAQLIALGRPHLGPLIEGLPFISHFEPAHLRPFDSALRARIRLLGADAALLLPNSFRSALCAWRWGIPHRAGYATDIRGVLLTDRAQPARGLYDTAALYRDLASWWTGTPQQSRLPILAVTPAQAREADRILGSSAPHSRQLVVLNPGGNRADKRWPAEHFIDFAQRIVREAPPAAQPIIAVNGSADEADLCASIASRTGGIDLVARGITLGALKALLQRAALLVTNDTGPRHIAAGFGTPTIALFGPTDCRWTPTDYPRERILSADPFLEPGLVANDHPLRCAITRIAAGDVWSAAQQLLHPRASEA